MEEDIVLYAEWLDGHKQLSDALNNARKSHEGAAAEMRLIRSARVVNDPLWDEALKRARERWLQTQTEDLIALQNLANSVMSAQACVSDLRGENSKVSPAEPDGRGSIFPASKLA
jgi:hypothetical protein